MASLRCQTTQTHHLNNRDGFQFVDQVLVNIADRIDCVAPATRILFRGFGPVMCLAVPAHVQVDEEILGLPRLWLTRCRVC
jgi:hypothetical protein